MQEIRVGIIPAPELPESIARDLLDKFPDYFSKYIDDQVSWNVDILVDPLTGAAENVNDIIDEAIMRRKQKNWHYAICLTDLPIFTGKDIVLADANYEERVAQVSLPAFGSVPMKNRICNTIIELLSELYKGFSDIKGANQNSMQGKDMSHKEKKQVHYYGFKQEKTRKFSSIRKTKFIRKDEKVDVRYIVIPRMNGRLRILLGMTHANRPWTVFPSFKNVIAIAFATGAYGLIFPTLWKLSAAFALPRLLGLTAVSLFSMVVWVTIAHGLWEKRTAKSKKKLRRLYNTATLSTLSIAVMFYYIVLVILFFGMVSIFVPPELFAEEAGLKESATIVDYVKLAWLAASVATVAGAMGAGLENDELVRTITYGYRQRRRYKEMNTEKENSTKLTREIDQ
ncbi:hypothetical protein [Bacillus piscicola]|uniref:hypothetical protein n=1 Tax=Bacillus piscicola TaxID=1632684 RepID=UPI001F08ED94|nr:hypothetical protein [Bacillus piscicola]